jgi:hypothetical protein
MGRIPDDWDGETVASGRGSEDGPPTLKIKTPFPKGTPRAPRRPGTLHDLERLENVIFSDDEPKT